MGASIQVFVVGGREERGLTAGAHGVLHFWGGEFAFLFGDPVESSW